jgi:hypothetical protein
MISGALSDRGVVCVAVPLIATSQKLAGIFKEIIIIIISGSVCSTGGVHSQAWSATSGIGLGSKKYDKNCNRNICQDSFVKKCYAEHLLTKLRFALLAVVLEIICGLQNRALCN